MQENQDKQVVVSQNWMMYVVVFLGIIAAGVGLLSYQLVIVPRTAERLARIEAAKIKADREQAAIEFSKKDLVENYDQKDPKLIAVDNIEQAAEYGINYKLDSGGTAMEDFSSWTGDKQMLVLMDPESVSATKAYTIFIIISDQGEMHRLK